MVLVLEPEEKNAFLEAMADKYDRIILLCTSVKARAIEEIAKDYHIPISTCYRKVHELTSRKLLRVEKTILTDTGKKYELFRSAIIDASVRFSPGEVLVEVTPRPRESDERLTSLWRTVQKEAYSPVG